MEIFTKDLLKSASRSFDGLFAIEEQVYHSEGNMRFFHHHDHYEMIYMTDGKRVLTIGDTDYELNQGNIALFSPYVSHKITSLNALPKRRILINFKKEFIDNLIPDESFLNIFLTESHVLEFPPEAQPKISALMEEILSLYLYDSLYKELHIKLKLCELLLVLNCECCAPTHQNLDNNLSKKFTAIAHFISNDCCGKISLDNIAELFHIDKFQLSRQFKNYLGSSFVTYVNNVRITKARRMMLNGLTNVTEIATNCGFDSPTHFSRVFKHATGESPKQYMKREHSADNHDLK